MSTILLLNKPYGVICQFSPSGNRPTLGDFVSRKGVYPAGRLDTDSEGLLILTDDGALQHRVTDPRHKLAKTYFVQVEGAPGEIELEPIRSGIRLPDYQARPAEVSIVSEPAWLWPRVPPIRQRRHIPTTWLRIVLREGRNRQVRRMTAACGFPTLRLIREAIGPWSLAMLQPGEWREENPQIVNL